MKQLVLQFEGTLAYFNTHKEKKVTSLSVFSVKEV